MSRNMRCISTMTRADANAKAPDFAEAHPDQASALASTWAPANPTRCNDWLNVPATDISLKLEERHYGE